MLRDFKVGERIGEMSYLLQSVRKGLSEVSFGVRYECQETSQENIWEKALQVKQFFKLQALIYLWNTKSIKWAGAVPKKY